MGGGEGDGAAFEAVDAGAGGLPPFAGAVGVVGETEVVAFELVVEGGGEVVVGEAEVDAGGDAAADGRQEVGGAFAGGQHFEGGVAEEFFVFEGEHRKAKG